MLYTHIPVGVLHANWQSLFRHHLCKNLTRINTLLENEKIPVMNTTQSKLLRSANFIATGICLTLQTVLKRKLTFRTNIIMGTPGYAVAQSGTYSTTQSTNLKGSMYERLNGR
jgi:hypothetical protein